MTGELIMEEVDGIIFRALKSIGCDFDDEVYSIQQISTEGLVEAVARCLKVIDNDLDVPHRLPPSMSGKFRVGLSLAKAIQDLGYKGEVGYQTFLYSGEADIRKVLLYLLEKLPKSPSETAEEPLGSSALLQRAIGSEILARLSHPWTPSVCKRHGVCWRGSPRQWRREGVNGVRNVSTCKLASVAGVHDVTKALSKEVRSYARSELPFIDQQPQKITQLAGSVLETHVAELVTQQEWDTLWNYEGLALGMTPEEYKLHKKREREKQIGAALRESVAAARSASDSPPTLDQLMAKMHERTAPNHRTKGSRFTHTEKLLFTVDEEKSADQLMTRELEGPRQSEEDLQKKRDEEIQSLSQELGEISSRLEKLRDESKRLQNSKNNSIDRLSAFEEESKRKEKAYMVKKKTMDLLPDAENNITKLEALMDSSAQRLLNLGAQWEKHRVPLIEQYRNLKESRDSSKSQTQEKLAEIQQLRERMSDLSTEARGKDELHKQLVTEHERMTKDVNRSAYTKRILEIVSNIKKQKQEIDKVLLETKCIQKEINQLTGKLDRTFTVTDELIFKDAKKEEAVRKAYKYLAALHENCNAVIETVEETGSILREIRDLEDQIEQASTNKVLSNLQRITADYLEMKKENKALIEQVKQQS